ncbi:MAG: magnesium transporter CorA family protein [Isosphaeraceae bacterium]
MSLAAAFPTDLTSSEVTPRIRAIYRNSAGEIVLDWPADRLREALDDAGGTLWVDIEDLGPTPSLAVETLLREIFGFHPLAIEDALRESHIPRVDDWERYLYIVFHSIDFDARSAQLRPHELDVFLGPNFLVTYHNEPLGFLEHDRRNIERDPTNRMRHGPDHLLYRLLDLAVAEIVSAIETLDESIDALQDDVFTRPTASTLQAILKVKRGTLRLHRIVGPEREVLNKLARDSFLPIADDHRIYFRDVYDHIVRVHDLTESLRDLISGALDTYLSAISNRTNDVMKMLTLVTVMFLPLSFLTGFFGMNYFGETLAFDSPLPRRAMFLSTLLVMGTGFIGPWILARRRGWF